MYRKIIVSVLLALFLAVLTGCHTIHGAGEDVESVGHSIERATDK